MASKKTTRRALTMSILSLLLCVSMLIGTTFAWFTDSVTSGINTITAGNLDVELYHSDKAAPNGEKVTAKTVLFDDVTLWEPGAVAYENFVIKNEGNLALKYQLALNFANATDNGNGGTLADVLKVALVKGGFSGGRTEAHALWTNSNENVRFYDLSTFAQSGELKEGEATETYGVVVYWQPTDNDNDYNMNNEHTEILTIDLGINLFATQLEAESDSFGPDYDEDLWENALKATNAEELLLAIENVEDGGLIALGDNVTFDETTRTHNSGNYYDGLYYVGDKSFTLDLNGKKITNDSSVNDYLLNFKNDGSKANTITIKNGTLEAASSAYCAICTSSTSTQKITINLENVNVIGNNSNGAVAKIRGGSELNVKSGTVITGNDSYVGIEAAGSNTVVNIYDGAKIYQNGKSSNWGSLVGASGNATVNVYGGYGKSAKGGFMAMTSGGTINISGGEWIANTDGTYANDNNAVLIAQSDKQYNAGAGDSEIKVTGGTFKGGYNCYGNAVGDAEIIISGGNFNADPATYVADGYKVVETSSGYMVISADNDFVADGVLKSADEKTFYLSSKEGFEWMESQTDSYFAGKTVTLEESIDFGGETIGAVRFWQPENKTTFDGNGMTISNFVLEDTEGNAGLFNGTMTVKNLNIVGAEVTGKYAGVIAGNMYGDIINCTVKDSVINGTYWQTGALVGQYNSGNIIDCVVENCEINGLAAVGGLVGILNESTGERKIENCTVKDCEINQTGSFGGDYDKMFGVVTGFVNIENSTVTISGVYENNTVKGVASDVLCGDVVDSTKVYVLTTANNGMKLKEDVATGAKSLSSVADLTEEAVTIPAEVSALGNAVFAGNANITTVTIPATVTDFGASGVSDTNASGGAFKGSNVETVVLSDGITEIPAAAFNGATKLTSVNIPASVKKIGVNAFRSTAITELTIPATVEEIAYGAFRDMDSLTTVTIEGTNVTLPGYVFRDCTNLRTVYLNMDNLTLNGSMNFANASSNNANTNNITFYCKNTAVADAVLANMGVGSYVAIYVDGVLYAEIK